MPTYNTSSNEEAGRQGFGEGVGDGSVRVLHHEGHGSWSQVDRCGPWQRTEHAIDDDLMSEGLVESLQMNGTLCCLIAELCVVIWILRRRIVVD